MTSQCESSDEHKCIECGGEHRVFECPELSRKKAHEIKKSQEQQNRAPNKRRRSRSPSPRLEKPKHSRSDEPIDLTSFNYCRGTEENDEVLTRGLNFSDKC